VIVGRAGFENGVDIAAAVAALRGIVEARADLEFLDDVGAGERCVVELADGVVVRPNAFDLIVIIVVAPAVDVHADGAAPELRSRIKRGRGACREGQ